MLPWLVEAPFPMMDRGSGLHKGIASDHRRQRTSSR